MIFFLFYDIRASGGRVFIYSDTPVGVVVFSHGRDIVRRNDEIII